MEERWNETEGRKEGGRGEGERVSMFEGRIRGMIANNCCALLK